MRNRSGSRARSASTSRARRAGSKGEQGQKAADKTETTGQRVERLMAQGMSLKQAADAIEAEDKAKGDGSGLASVDQELTDEAQRELLGEKKHLQLVAFRKGEKIDRLTRLRDRQQEEFEDVAKRIATIDEKLRENQELLFRKKQLALQPPAPVRRSLGEEFHEDQIKHLSAEHQQEARNNYQALKTSEDAIAKSWDEAKKAKERHEEDLDKKKAVAQGLPRRRYASPGAGPGRPARG